MKERLIAGLDIGSSAIRIAVGQVLPAPEHQTKLSFIGAAEVKSEGIAKGGISSFEDAVSSITACLDQAERMVGLPINDVYVGVGGSQITVQDAKGIVGVSRSDQTIRREDVVRVLEAARTYAQAPNYDILHVLPKRFTVDNQKDIKDPVGMQGIRLEADAKIIQGLSNHLRNTTKAVFRTNVDISELVYVPLASAEAVTTKRQRELGVCVITLGASTTSLAVYEDNELVHAATFLMGSDHVTSDLVYTLRTSFEVAERLKRAKGNALSTVFEKNETADLKDYGADVSEQVQLGFVSEVIEARIEEIFERIEAELKRIERSGMLPAGIVLTGGGAKLNGVTEVARNIFHLPATVGMPHAESSIPELVQDPSFSTAVGLVLWGYEAERQEVTSFATSAKQSGAHWMSKVSDPIKKIFKSFMP